MHPLRDEQTSDPVKGKFDKKQGFRFSRLNSMNLETLDLGIKSQYHFLKIFLNICLLLEKYTAPMSNVSISTFELKLQI